MSQKSLAGAVLLAALLMAALGSGLRPDTFFSGDCGLKLMLALHTSAHPGRPFEIDLPSVNGHPMPFVDQLTMIHGTHAHALQAPIFPVLSAPLVSAFGMRGAYLLPAASFAVIVVLLEVLRRRAAPATPAWPVALTALVASPVFFYALEFWEHAPAFALAAAALALAWRQTPVTAALAGVMAGASALMRPETALYAAALVAFAPRSLADRARMAAGVGVPLALFAAANYAHFGDPLGGHLSAVAGSATADWWASHLARLNTWFGPSSALDAAGLLLIAAAWLIVAARRDTPIAPIVAAAGAVLIGAAAAWGLTSRDSLWQMFPAAALALAPGVLPRLPRMRAMALAGIASMFLLSTHDGGAQWGPRYILAAMPPMLLLTGVAAGSLISREGRWSGARVALTAAALVLAAGTSRAAYRELDGSKDAYGTIVDAAREAVPAGGVLVSDVWWVAQITAADYRRHTVLTASPDAPVETIAGALHRAGARVFVLAQSREDGAERRERIGCYEAGRATEVLVRGIVLTPYHCPNP